MAQEQRKLDNREHSAGRYQTNERGGPVILQGGLQSFNELHVTINARHADGVRMSPALLETKHCICKYRTEGAER